MYAVFCSSFELKYKLMKSLNRRSFLKTTATGAAGLAVASSVKASDNRGDDDKKKNSKIITRKLGNTGIEIPVVSMGCGRVDSPSVVKGAMKLGINHFDTAHRYQKGNSERLLGETLKEYPRESFTIATKVKAQSSKVAYLKMFDESLERLQMNYVDILYLHAVSSREDVLNEEMLEALKEAKRLGKAKHIGLSTHKNEPEVIQAAIDSNIFEVVLTSLNFKQEHFSEIQSKIKLASDKGIGIIAMKVMAGGFLDTERLNPVNHTAALKWSLKNSSVATAIPSMVNLEQLQQNAKVLKDVNLTEQESQEIMAATSVEGLFCNGCEKCVGECVKALPIAEIMRAYMYSYGYRDSLKAKGVLRELNLDANPCSGCNNCTVECVKNFNIAQKIHEVNQLREIPDSFLA